MSSATTVDERKKEKEVWGNMATNVGDVTAVRPDPKGNGNMGEFTLHPEDPFEHLLIQLVNIYRSEAHKGRTLDAIRATIKGEFGVG